jgi:hypothetical protein
MDSLPVQQDRKLYTFKNGKTKKAHYTVEDWKQHIIERTLIHPITGCWIWQKAILQPSKANPSGGGYGMITFYENGKQKMRTVHRVAYELWVGPIPEGREICHSDLFCYSKACCNPDHLYAGTRQQNARDAAAAGKYNSSGAHKRGKKIYGDGKTRRFFLEGTQPEGWTRSPQKDYSVKLYGNGVERGFFKIGKEPAGWHRLIIGGPTGSKWYTDGLENIRIYPGESIPEGYRPGHTNWNPIRRKTLNG